MKIVRRKFGNTELQVSLLGLGTADLGFSGADDDAFDRLLNEACRAGINVLDSAAMYGDSEERLGRLLSGRRDQFLIFTKCGRHLPKLNGPSRYLRKARRMVGKWIGEPPYEWLPGTLQSNIEDSLRRLRTDRNRPYAAAFMLDGNSRARRRNPYFATSQGSRQSSLYRLQRGWARRLVGRPKRMLRRDSTEC